MAEYYTSQVLVETGPTQAEIDSASETVQAMYATWRNSPPVELYDLKLDPHEQVNLADKAELEEVRKRLMTELRQWREQTKDPFLDPAKIEQLAEEHRQQDAIVRAQGRGAYRPWRYPEYLYGQR